MYCGGSVLTRAHMGQSKTQFYSGNGTGRDGYILLNNGGLCPPTSATKIEELGKFYFHFHKRVYQRIYIDMEGNSPIPLTILLIHFIY